ncbi:MAG: glycerate kinase family protein [Acidimicrobiales bacterium]
MGSTRIIAAPDSFKETSSAIQVTHAICEAASRLGMECDPIPMSDGGEGFAETYVNALALEHAMAWARDPAGQLHHGGLPGDRLPTSSRLPSKKPLAKHREEMPAMFSRHAHPDCTPGWNGTAITTEATREAGMISRHAVTVTGPTGEPVEASYYVVNPGDAPSLAVMDCASASGLALAGGARHNDPVTATSRGTGELIAAAIDANIKRILIGLGGSACTDGGSGAVDAITQLCDTSSSSAGTPASSPAGGPAGNLAGTVGKSTAGILDGVDLAACYDVSTAFLDAATVFAPQKGATLEQVDLLSRRLEDLAHRYKTAYGVDVAGLPGSGAAGGLGGGLAALGARLVPGFDVIANAARLQTRLAGASLVITGEGRLDATSFKGKVVGRIIRAAQEQGVPVAVIAGSVDYGLTARASSGMGSYLVETSAMLTRQTEPPTRQTVKTSDQPAAGQVATTTSTQFPVVSLTEKYGSADALTDTPACVMEVATSILTDILRPQVPQVL